MNPRIPSPYRAPLPIRRTRAPRPRINWRTVSRRALEVIAAAAMGALWLAAIIALRHFTR